MTLHYQASLNSAGDLSSKYAGWPAVAVAKYTFPPCPLMVRQIVSLGDHQDRNDIGSAWIKDATTNYKLPWWVTPAENFVTRRKCLPSLDLFHCYDCIQGRRVRSRRASLAMAKRMEKQNFSNFWIWLFTAREKYIWFNPFPSKKVHKFTILSQTHKIEFAFFVIADNQKQYRPHLNNIGPRLNEHSGLGKF